MTPDFPSTVKRYCPDRDCPSWRRPRKGGDTRGRHIGESAIGAYGRFYCPECRHWWTWNGGELTGKDTMILEDEL